MGPLIANNLSFAYPRGNEVLNSLCLNVNLGEIIAISGPSGCGKSTLLGLLAGFLRAKAGEIRLGNKIFSNNNIFLQPEKRSVGMVFQNASIFPHMTINKNVIFAAKSKEQKKLAKFLMSEFGLSGLADSYPSELSGGQKQRVALARALVALPSLLLLDESFSALDYKIKKNVIKITLEVIRNYQITTIFVSHNATETTWFAERVLSMESMKQKSL